jgi:hypothetical protein
VHEIKHDGYRLIVRRDGKAVRLFTGRGYDRGARYPANASAAAKLRARSFLPGWRGGGLRRGWCCLPTKEPKTARGLRTLAIDDSLAETGLNDLRAAFAPYREKSVNN